MNNKSKGLHKLKFSNNLYILESMWLIFRMSKIKES